MNRLALNQKEKKKLLTLSNKGFNKLSKTKQEELLKLGAKDFSKRFSKVIRDLSRT
jgi:predicted AlkP superfamily phosphohydrolase/phosphomutase